MSLKCEIENCNKPAYYYPSSSKQICKDHLTDERNHLKEREINLKKESKEETK